MPRTQPKKSEETKHSPKKSKENELNRRKMKPSPKESRVRVFSLSLGFAAWVCGFAPGFMGLPLGSWVRRLGLWFLF